MAGDPCAKCKRAMATIKKWFQCSECKAYFCPSCMDRFCLFCRKPVKEVPVKA